MERRVTAVTSHASGERISRCVCPVPAQIRVLDDVLGVAAGAEHAIGHTAQFGAVVFEDLGAVGGCHVR